MLLFSNLCLVKKLTGHRAHVVFQTAIYFFALTKYVFCFLDDRGGGEVREHREEDKRGEDEEANERW